MPFELSSSTFDMENVLTRAVHRVLNNNNTYDYSHNSVEKPKVHFQNNVSQSQIRLVADQLCRRIEKRYEKRLADELARERHQTERKLAQIRNEYRDDLDLKRKELQNEKQVMEERVREKERTLQHMMDLRELDKQSNISVQRTLLENRYSELKLAQDRLEKAGEEFKKRVKADLETVRLEREKLALKESDVMTASEFSAQARDLKESRDKISEYEHQLEKQRLKIADLERENVTIKDKNTHLEEEVRLVLFRLKDNRPSGESFMISELMAENSRLKEDLIKAQVRSSSTTSNELSRLRREWDHKEQAHLLKIREQKHIIDMMHDKIRNLSSDRTYLQKRVKDLQRDQLYESRKEREPKTGGRRSKKEKLPKWSEEETSSDSTMSNGSVEIANIKKRISNLDQIAKELDASVDMFSYVNKSRHEAYESYHEEDSHGYDDFCRNWAKNGGFHSSPVKSQKPEVIRTEVPITRQRREANHHREERRASNPHLVTTTTSESLQEQQTVAPQLPIESDFAARMRLRNEELTRKASLAKEEEIVAQKPLDSESVPPEKSTQPSALLDYISMFSKPKDPSASTSKPQIEPTFDEVQFDQAPAYDDEIDW